MGRLRHVFAMRVLRVASASVLSLVALLAWRAAEPSAARVAHVDGPTAVASAVTQDGGTVVAAARPVTHRKSAQSARVGSRSQLLVRSRAADGDGDPTPSYALACSPAEALGDVAESTRARLRWLALGHAPYGEPSPFDATAPPTSSPRNG